jgi:CrcB protein
VDPEAVEPSATNLSETNLSETNLSEIEQGDIDPDLDRPRWGIALAVSAGGAVGGLARLGLNTLLPRSGAGFPWATCVENVTGCLLIGVLMAFVVDVWPPNRYRRPFLGTGVLGGFTTFSAYTSDTRALLQAGHAATALAYLAVSLLLGLAGVVVGLRLVRTLRTGSP